MLKRADILWFAAGHYLLAGARFRIPRQKGSMEEEVRDQAVRVLEVAMELRLAAMAVEMEVEHPVQERQAAGTDLRQTLELDQEVAVTAQVAA